MRRPALGSDNRAHSGEIIPSGGPKGADFLPQDMWSPIAASLIAAVVTTVAIFVIRRYEDWANRNATYFACFAAGVLIAVSFLHIVPRSFAMAENAPLYLFAGYLFMHGFNRFVTAYVCDKPSTANYALGDRKSVV